MSKAEARLRQRFAPLFSAMGDETRLALLDHLAERGVLSIASLTATTSVTRQAVTKHLRVLEAAGLVRCTEQGRERQFTVVPETLDASRQYLEAITKHWDDALKRLKAHAERL